MTRQICPQIYQNHPTTSKEMRAKSGQNQKNQNVRFMFALNPWRSHSLHLIFASLHNKTISHEKNYSKTTPGDLPNYSKLLPLFTKRQRPQ